MASLIMLPNEIKDQIYLLAIELTFPRIISMKLRRRTRQPLNVKPRVKDFAYYSPTTIPPLLHTCSHTRHLARKRWTLAFTSVQPDGIWVDFKTDTFSFLLDDYLSPGSLTESQISILQFRIAIPEAERKLVARAQVDWADLLYNLKLLLNVQKVALTNRYDARSRNWNEREEFITAVFPRLKSLVLVVGSRGLDDGKPLNWGGYMGGRVRNAIESEKSLRRTVKACSGGDVTIVKQGGLQTGSY